MFLELDKSDLSALVRGSGGPQFSLFNHPLVRKAGHAYYDQVGRTNWDKLSNLSEEELITLYELIKESR